MTDHTLARAVPALPSRFERPGLTGFAMTLGILLFFMWSVQRTGVSLSEFIQGFPQMGRLVGEMLPPSTARLGAVGKALLETFQMAFVGTVVGVLISVPIAVLATRHLTPHPALYHLARNLIAFARTVPDLLWALLFIVSVGLGPFAGTLAIIVDKIGFCGRFFAEAMEEVDRGPQEALSAIGADKLSLVMCAVIPAAMPSFINTSLFSLEKATRSSVVLGLVGAGGIGIELKVAMDLFNYDEAATIILAIFALVILVEQASAWLRRRVI
ncbi:MAG: phosphonate ABC transporter, permease protein PhnE [Burkholderiales bacterium RIFOXYD2_FULL_59_8]|nr:MAG: phosphonate ABC transporter, permease protein PhnE [Burkholderiales bacterium RIFOXYD12_FULL_59_19]OGB82340.1 MAG: phosphonate ABC transporter, permease protein PhnE [Burkholderiales bacterium RIFOXYC12_FULL_60_6]OGB86667.1 MAG: phosphonate ABC transporter, permease protein PhnE [Burkholderiales bacterium RIFOXYD2_FULL_59_8]